MTWSTSNDKERPFVCRYGGVEVLEQNNDVITMKVDQNSCKIPQGNIVSI